MYKRQERALAIEPTPETESYRKGVEMIYQQLIHALTKEGVSEIEAQGKEFDPNFQDVYKRQGMDLTVFHEHRTVPVNEISAVLRVYPVSHTHLDVYKRQAWIRSGVDTAEKAMAEAKKPRGRSGRGGSRKDVLPDYYVQMKTGSEKETAEETDFDREEFEEIRRRLREQEG